MQSVEDINIQRAGVIVAIIASQPEKTQSNEIANTKALMPTGAVKETNPEVAIATTRPVLPGKSGAVSPIIAVASEGVRAIAEPDPIPPPSLHPAAIHAEVPHVEAVTTSEVPDTYEETEVDQAAYTDPSFVETSDSGEADEDELSLLVDWDLELSELLEQQIFPESEITAEVAEGVYEQIVEHWIHSLQPESQIEFKGYESGEESSIFIEIDPDTPNEFEADVLAREEVAEVSNIHEVMYLATKEQSVEKTFTQLAILLAEPKENHGVELEMIRQDVIELADLMLKVEDELVVGGEFSPEAVQKILVLLERLGYEDPARVLSVFMDEHDFMYLVQAVSYLQTAAHTPYSQEFIYDTHVYPVSDEDSIPTRLGRMVIGIIHSSSPYVQI